MTGLPPSLRLYFDEDVDVLLARLLAARGLDCLTAVEAGHLGWNDEAHLLFSDKEERVLISHNRLDFERLAVSWWNQKKTHSGIILAMRRPSAYELARRVLAVIGLYDQTGWRNTIVYA